MRVGLVGWGLGGLVFLLVGLFFGVDPGVLINEGDPTVNAGGRRLNLRPMTP
jgi:hypothetical protein